MPKSPRRCTASSSRTGRACKKAPIRGGTVCRTHGGAAPQVRRKAEERLADLIDPDRLLREMARLAYFDARRLYDARGNLLPPKDWPDDVAAVVASVEVIKKNIVTGDGLVDDVIKVRHWDKVKAIEMLAKHLGLLKEQLEHTGGISIRWQG